MNGDLETIQKRIDELGTEYRRLFLIIASGLFVGGSIRKPDLASGQNQFEWGLIIVGLAAIVILANVLWSKHRKVKEKLALCKEKGVELPVHGYFFSVAFFDFIGLIFLVVGIGLTIS